MPRLPHTMYGLPHPGHKLCWGDLCMNDGSALWYALLRCNAMT